MALVLDDATAKLIVQALTTGKQYGLTRCIQALEALKTPVLKQIAQREQELCLNEATTYIHEDELRLLAYLRGEITHGIHGVDEFAKLRDHILPGHYSPMLRREVEARLAKGDKKFLLPEGEKDKPILGSDEEH